MQAGVPPDNYHATSIYPEYVQLKKGGLANPQRLAHRSKSYTSGKYELYMVLLSGASHPDYAFDILALRRMRAARDVLKAPQTQNFAMYPAAFSGVNLPSFTLSIIFSAKLLDIRP